MSAALPFRIARLWEDNEKRFSPHIGPSWAWRIGMQSERQRVFVNRKAHPAWPKAFRRSLDSERTLADFSDSLLVLRQPRIHAARHVFHAGEAVTEKQLHGLGGAAAGLAVDEDVAVRWQAI